MDFELDPVESRRLADQSDPNRFVGVACAGRVQHDLDLAPVDGFQDIVVPGVVLMNAGQCGRDELGFRGLQRSAEKVRRGEFAGSEKKTVGELASPDDEFFHVFCSSILFHQN